MTFTTNHTDASAEDPLAPDVGFLLAKTASLSTRQVRTSLRPLGLQVRSYTLLSLVCALGPMTQRELAMEIALDPSQLVPLIDDLEQQGLVTREPDPSDRRTRQITATPLGGERQREAHAAVAPALITRTAGFTPAEESQLVSMLQRLIRSAR